MNDFNRMTLTDSVDYQKAQYGGFESWRDEKTFQRKYGAMYYQTSPDRIGDALVATNDFRLFDTRTTQMSDHIKQLQTSAIAPQWRYDTLVKRVREKLGKITLDDAKEILEFLSPTQAPDYHQSDSIIDGFLAVIDISYLRVYLKINQWSSEWEEIDLNDYFF